MPMKTTISATPLVVLAQFLVNLPFFLFPSKIALAKEMETCYNTLNLK